MADDDKDDIFEDRETGDDISDAIRSALAKQPGDDDEDADSAFATDLGDDDPLDMVDAKRGQELASEARVKDEKASRTKDAKADDKAETDEQDEPDQPADTEPDEGQEAEQAQAEDLTALGLDDLMKGVQHTKRAEIVRRVKEAEQLMAVAKRPYIAQQIKQHNATPGQVIDRLGELAEFAAQKPDEYLAWVTAQSAQSPEKIPEVLGRAAKLLGYKVVPDAPEGEDDAFEDERVLALKREVAALKAAQGGQTNFGPDTPDRVQHRTIAQQMQSFVSETDEAGQPKRPHWRDLEPQITAMAPVYQQQQGGRALTFADLDALYQQAEGQMRARFGASAATPAAPQPQAVADQMKQRAAAAEKAMRASKSVDGTGQGASRRPALPEDADLGDVIRRFAGL